MGNSERKEFDLYLKIKDSDGQVKELRDKWPIELEVDNDKAHGEQFVLFKKDGKEYPVKVNIEEVDRGFIKDRLKSAKFEIPKNADFSYYHEKDGSSWHAELTQPLRVGRIIGLSLFAVLAIGGIITLVLWKKKHPST